MAKAITVSNKGVTGFCVLEKKQLKTMLKEFENQNITSIIFQTKVYPSVTGEILISASHIVSGTKWKGTTML
jgi:hypothetical protein